MKFFIPHAKDEDQAERVYNSIAKFISAPVNKKRVQALVWEHNGMEMACEVGGTLPSYYGTRDEPVIAIFDCGNLYQVCTTNRGVIRGEAVLAGKGFSTFATHFDDSIE